MLLSSSQDGGPSDLFLGWNHRRLPYRERTLIRCTSLTSICRWGPWCRDIVAALVNMSPDMTLPAPSRLVEAKKISIQFPNRNKRRSERAHATTRGRLMRHRLSLPSDWICQNREMRTVIPSDLCKRAFGLFLSPASAEAIIESRRASDTFGGSTILASTSWNVTVMRAVIRPDLLCKVDYDGRHSFPVQDSTNRRWLRTKNRTIPSDALVTMVAHCRTILCLDDCQPTGGESSDWPVQWTMERLAIQVMGPANVEIQRPGRSSRTARHRFHSPAVQTLLAGSQDRSDQTSATHLVG